MFLRQFFTFSFFSLGVSSYCIEVGAGANKSPIKVVVGFILADAYQGHLARNPYMMSKRWNKVAESVKGEIWPTDTLVMQEGAPDGSIAQLVR